MKLKTPVAFLVTLGVLGGGLTLGIESSIYAFSRGRSAHDELETLARALTHVEEHYTDEVPLTDLVYSAIDGIAKSLDKHSQFFDPEEYRRLKEDNDGNYFGVGIQIRPHEDGGLLVVGVFEGGPAAGAGSSLKGGGLDGARPSRPLPAGAPQPPRRDCRLRDAQARRGRVGRRAHARRGGRARQLA